ncbi:MAG: GTPase HflX [Phycisphaerae bacterium]|nr:GTPase HflX [Phycisphaerae bacterium]|tara:strand:- start:8692 stop:10083 length:1392 start_codon:yes stop_codon:yes gene_type:complete
MGHEQREDLNVVAERAILVALTLRGERISLDDRFTELSALTESAGGIVVGHVTQKRRLPHGKTFIGKGKVIELKELADSVDATIIIFDHDMSPSQIQNLEEATEKKIIDRSELILDIFSSRASTAEAKLQVEIAQLQYTYPRLRAMWDHLGQVTGGAPVGIGTRGPGEQQIEIDRRLVQRRLKQLRLEVEEIQQRSVREVEKRNNDHFTVGLVGYTNAGKSTLFNVLTSGGAWAHDQLFATLSTRIDRWELGGGMGVMLSDTVGFIRRLPHHLVASFRSTLEETVHCQLLLILLDASDPSAMSQLDTVEKTLKDIGAEHQPRLLVLNKIDQLEDPFNRLVWVSRCPDAIQISSVTNEGIEMLSEEVRQAVIGPVREVTISLPIQSSKAIDFLEKRTEIVERAWEGNRALYTVRIGRNQIEQILSRDRTICINEMPAVEAIESLWSNLPQDGDCCHLPPHRLQE